MQFLESLLPPHFTRRNRIIFFLSILFSFGSFIALLKVTPKSEKQSHVMLATLVEQDQYVTRKFSNSLSFNEINKGEKLFNGDQIFTGESSSAKVVFQKSGNILNIPPRGLVKIEEGQSGENVDIQKGLAEFVIQKGQSINITQGNEVITLKANDKESGKGKIFFSDKKLILQVDSGQISLNDSKGLVQEVNKNETVSVENEGVTKVAGVGLTSPTWGQKIDIWDGLNLVWTDKGAIDAILYKDSGLTDVAGRVTASKSPFNWVLPIKEGQYYLSVKHAGKKNIEGSSIPLEMISAHSLNTFSPADRTALNLKRGEGVTFTWNEVPAIKYKVVVRDQDGKSSSYITQTPELVLKDIKGSALEWTVSPQVKSGAFLGESAINHLKLSFDNENKILSPKENQNYIFGKDKIQLSWFAAKNERIHIKLTNSNQSEVAIDRDFNETKLDYTPTAPGLYTLEVASKDYPSANPAVVKFVVASYIAEWEAKKPIELSAIDPDEQKVELKFNPINKNLNEMEVNIYSDEALKNKIASSKVLSNTIIYTVKRFGNFCFVLRPVDQKSAWLPSSAQCISYKQLAPFDGVASTKNIILKYKKVGGVGSYLINLPVMERAAFYEIQVFDEAEKVVFSDRSKSNVITWPSSKTGIFYYKYRVVDSKGRASIYSAVSKLIFPISPLTDWQE